MEASSEASLALEHGANLAGQDCSWTIDVLMDYEIDPNFGVQHTIRGLRNILKCKLQNFGKTYQVEVKSWPTGL